MASVPGLSTTYWSDSESRPISGPCSVSVSCLLPSCWVASDSSWPVDFAFDFVFSRFCPFCPFPSPSSPPSASLFLSNVWYFDSVQGLSFVTGMTSQGTHFCLTSLAFRYRTISFSGSSIKLIGKYVRKWSTGPFTKSVFDSRSMCVHASTLGRTD
jgi:hypothetical protein